MTAWLWAPLLLPPGLIAVPLLLDALDRRVTEHAATVRAPRGADLAAPRAGAAPDARDASAPGLHPAA